MKKIIDLRSCCLKKLGSMLILLTIFLSAYQLNAAENGFGFDQSKKMSLKELFTMIEEKSDYTVFYDAKDIDVQRQVELKGDYKNLDDIFKQVFAKEKELEYHIFKKQVLIKKVAPKAIDNQDDKIVLKGVVQEESGDPIIGANIYIKGSTNGTTTNIDGGFTITCKRGDVLVASFIGFSAKEITIENANDLKIVLALDSEQIEEVVAVGYAMQKKVDLTGSVSVVKAEELSRQPVVQVSQALTGKIPGLTAIQTSGQPGSDGASLTVRGQGSISASSSPLVLIDGVEGDLNGLDPNDIENFSVLKDAGAAAIYGSRASNGVILVTTKRAKAGEMKVEYNGYMGFQDPTNLVNPVSAADYYKYKGDTQMYDKYTNDPNKDNTDLFPNTDWVDLLFSENGAMQYHNISVSGGTESLRSKASLSYQDQDGNIAHFNYKRYQGRYNVDFKMSEKFDIQFDINFRRGEKTSPVSGNQVWMAYRTPATNPYMWKNGNYADSELGGNIIANVNESGLNKTIGNYFRGTLKAIYRPIDGLTIMAMYTPEYYEAITEKVSTPYELYPEHNTDAVNVYGGKDKEISVYNKSARNFTHNFTATANYNKSVGEHSFGVLVGTESIQYSNSHFQASRWDYSVEYPILDLGNAENMTNGGSANHYALLSYFGRVNYNFNNRYLFAFNVRRDGSSRFAEDNRWGVFPSVSLGWNLTNESFFPKIDQLTRLKLRGSWGQLGNQAINKNFPYASVISVGNSHFANGTFQQGAAQNVMANKNISWEKSDNLNIGLDFGLFNNRLDGSVEYYVRNTLDLLGTQQITGLVGLGSPQANIYSMKNRGLDVSLKWRAKIGNVSYHIGGNIALLKNEITDLNGVDFIRSGSYILQVGEAINSFYGYESDGYFESQEEIDNAPSQFGTLVPGDIKYKDQLTVDTDGDGVADAGDGVINTDDRVIIGNAFPTTTYNFNFGVEYKGFDINVDMQGVANRDVYLNGTIVMPFFNVGNITEWMVENSWTPENTNARLPVIKNYTKGDNNAQTNSTYIFDASYLRIRNITLGYTVPKAILSRTFIKRARIYISGQNLFTFSDMPDGVDPQVPNSTNGNFYPVVKTYTMGVNLTF